jgi:hypothetical protein
VKLLQEKVGSTLEHISIGNNFMNRIPKAQQLRERTNERDSIKLKSFYTVKETVNRLKRQPTEWKKIFVSYTSDQGLITRIYRELKKLTSQRINNFLNKWQMN